MARLHEREGKKLLSQRGLAAPKVAVAPGLIACASEEPERTKPMQRVIPAAYEYNGPSDRALKQ